jgi:hypothetical protein
MSTYGKFSRISKREVKTACPALQLSEFLD